MSDEIFPTLLDYIQSIKGGMRQMALDIASKKLKSPEDLDKASIESSEWYYNNFLMKEDKDDEATEAAVPEDVKKRAGKVVDILTAE